VRSFSSGWAVPPAIAARLVPGLVVPDDYAPIVNAHFRYPAPVAMPLFSGLVGGTARASDTVSDKVPGEK